jgi:predicted DNA-binding transcriptional regulator YafY
MPATKNAIIRYHIIDQCLSNTGRRYSFDDLKSAVEEKLMEIDPESGGISVRALRDDLNFMRSVDGYDAPIESFRDGKHHFYRYTDPNFSINRKPLNATEIEKLKNTITIFQRFEGGIEFEWLDEIGPKLEDFFGLSKAKKKIISHEHNADYVGQNFFSTFFNAISNEQVLNVHYKTFKNDEYHFNFHPYYLKQYNTRWFVIGFNEEHKNPHWNIPLDRIVAIEPVKISYRKDTTDWEDYFSDMIGVTRPEEAEPERVVLRFNPEQTPYVITKPMHPSQRKPIILEDGRADIRLEVILNYELKQRILSFGDSVEVIEPTSLRNEIAEIAKNMMKNYK